MGDEAPPEEPLLVDDTNAVWDAIEDGSNRNAAITVQQLIRQDPDHVIAFLAKKGVIKLGDFKIQVSCLHRVPTVYRLLSAQITAATVHAVFSAA